MSYPFYIHAATSSTASQHPCRLFFAAAAVAAPFILISNSAYAALNCTTQPTCEQFGYSKSVDANCDDYILCPFDTSYKKCINNTTISINNEACAGFPLLWCPANAECFSCTSGNPQYGGYVRYKIRGCNSGFMLTDDSRCVHTTCSHFYGKRPEDCGPTGAEGYMMGTKTDNNGCFECLWKECPEGSQTYAPKCATGEMEVVVGYNAGMECTKCETVQCPSGYAKAMLKYKLNKQTEQIGSILDYASLYSEELRESRVWYAAELMNKLGAIPPEMIDENDREYIYDVFGNKILINFSGDSKADYKRMQIYIGDSTRDICINLFQMAKLRSGLIWQTLFTRSTEDVSGEFANRVFGDAYCTRVRTCLKDLTLDKMDELCSACTGTTECSFYILWDFQEISES